MKDRVTPAGTAAAAGPPVLFDRAGRAHDWNEMVKLPGVSQPECSSRELNVVVTTVHLRDGREVLAVG